MHWWVHAYDLMPHCSWPAAASGSWQEVKLAVSRMPQRPALFGAMYCAVRESVGFWGFAVPYTLSSGALVMHFVQALQVWFKDAET